MEPHDAVSTLSKKISETTATALGMPDNEAQTFLPILIELLPFLADLLGKNCQAANGAALRAVAAANGPRGRVFRWQYRRAVRQAIGNQEDYNAWGLEMGNKTLETITDPNNDAMVTAALKARPAPVWGIFTAAS